MASAAVAGRKNDSILTIVDGAKDAKTALLTLVSLKFERRHSSVLNWNAHTPLRGWDGIKLLGALALNDTVGQDCNSIVQQLDIGSPPLKGKLRLEELGLKLLTHHLLVLKIVDNEKVRCVQCS